MASRLRSHRFRRRLLWVGGIAAVVGIAVGGAIRVGDTGRHYDTKLVDKPAWVYRTPPAANLTTAERHQVMNVISRFIKTAVARKQLDSAYDLTLPELRGETTRKEWHSGNIRVVPFPAARRSDLALFWSSAGRPA